MVTLGRALLLAVGLLDAAAGAALQLTPQWFFDNIGRFPPFNRHYEGDAGAFLLPIGVGLLIAAWRPDRYRALVWLALAASWLHAANHVVDALATSALGGASLLVALEIVGTTEHYGSVSS